MDLKIFTPQWDFAGVLDDFANIEYTICFSSTGQLKAKFAYTPNNLKLIQQDFILYIDDFSCFEISSIYYNKDFDGRTITVVANHILYWLEDCIVKNKGAYDGNAEAFLLSMAKNCTNRISNMIVPPATGISEIVSYEQEYSTVLSQMQKICELSRLGIQLKANPLLKSVEFSVIPYRDKTINQSTISPFVLSTSFENVLTEEYFRSNTGYKNSIYLYDSEKGTSLVFNQCLPGERTREMLIEDKTVTQARAKELLEEYKRLWTYTAKMDEYKSDSLEVGDLITVKNDEWKLFFDMPVLEINVIIDTAGKKKSLTFGNLPPNINQIMKRKGVIR